MEAAEGRGDGVASALRSNFQPNRRTSGGVIQKVCAAQCVMVILSSVPLIRPHRMIKLKNKYEISIKEVVLKRIISQKMRYLIFCLDLV